MADLDSIFSQLRHICEQMEDKSVSFEDKMKLYADGVELQRQADKILADANRMVVEIVSQAPDGSLVIEPFVSEPPKELGDSGRSQRSARKNLQPRQK